ncbi:MAG: OmpA family protein [Bacteroidales bacterium]|nr:OmpA family protein [Bacteroidales bacterium]
MLQKFLPLILVTALLFSFYNGHTQSRRTEAADLDFENMRYSLALPKYKKAYSRVKGNKMEKNRITYQMAECYRLMNQPNRSEAFYKRLVRANYDRSEPVVLLKLADAQRANGKYEEALGNYEIYVEREPGDPMGKVGVESCKLALEWLENPSNFQIEKLKRFNSREDDFSPAYAEPTANAVIFTSSREGSTGKNADEWTGMSFTDLYYAKQDKKMDWSNPVLADETEVVNTEANEGQSAFNENFSKMYFTRCGKDNVTVNGCQVYVVKKQGRGWGEPEKVELGGDSTSVFGHPAVSPDETFIIFSSPKKGGAGGKDLWIASRKGASGDFSSPRNLGSAINTKGDEVFPSMRGDSVLYFASTGHPGMGGLDIFKSKKLEDDTWSDPVNVRPPLNTEYDDFGITWHPDGMEQGFFSSNRKGGRGGDDIWFFINPPKLYTVVGKVLDNNILQPIEGADVSLISSDGTTMNTKTNSVGYFEFTDDQVQANTTFEIIVVKDNYFNEKAMETTVGLEASKDFEMNFNLEPIPAEPIVLPEILYDLGKWELKPQFQDSLQGLIETLDANETIVVEIASHTDARDNDQRNDILSQKRAESVVDYLILRGIDPDRMLAKGYGERVPFKVKKKSAKAAFTFNEGVVLTESFIDSLPTVDAKEAAHQMNRRTEFSIVSKDYVPKPKIRTDFESNSVEVVVNPEEHILPYILTPRGLIQADCIVNGFTLNFIFDRRAIRPSISLGSALRLLKEGAINKNSFVGDPEQILGNGTIANRSIFKAENMRIGGITIYDLEIQVDHQLSSQMVLGEITLGEFGDFQIDEEKKQIIFE